MDMKHSSIPAGRKFLPGVSAVRLREMYREEKDPKARERLQAYIMRKEGKGLSIRKICTALNKPYSTIRNWLVRAMDSGIVGRYDIVNKGAPCKLSDKQMKQLRADLEAGPRECGFESGVWTAPLVIAHARKRFGVQYSNQGMYNLLHRMGFTCRKPRPRNPGAASSQKVAAFKKKVRQIILDNPKHKVIAEDEASFIIGWNTQNGWYPKGKPVTTPVTLSRQRFHIFGALHSDGFDYWFYDKANRDSFKDMLEYLHRKHGKIIMVLDNASYHKAKDVKDFIDSFNGDIIPVYLPPYTPELNPSEGEWRLLRRVTGNVLYNDIDEMKNSIETMLESGEVKTAAMSSYLL